ncbi:alanyl-tRNA editing protein [Cribrihabitans neustonicus]|uniref:alanyl-tRNA editing protein n=1 Tax=Cribrihabitans neustonicus TaxID=1429085 RepID=UPI003B5ADF15
MAKSEPLYLSGTYDRSAETCVAEITGQGGVVLEETLFYPKGGGQPGDSGRLEWEGGACAIATTVKDKDGHAVLFPAEGETLPPEGAQVCQILDWERRYGHMRVHTALHLLSVVLPFGVTGGSIGETKGRLDFDMEEAPADKEGLQEHLQTLIDRDLEVTQKWITEEELDDNPQLVKTMSVAPPRGAGRVRLVRIGTGDEQVDLQPCGGTHVKKTGEIGRIRIGKIEKKGQHNRRVYLHLET